MINSGPKIRFLAILLCLIMLSGCWDLEEIDRRLFITTIGIDGDPAKEITVSIQVPVSQKMLPPGSSSGKDQGKNFITLSAQDRTVRAVFGVLQTKTYRTLVIEQNRAIIIGEDTAKLGVTPIMDWFFASSKTPPEGNIFIAHHHTAKEILSFVPGPKILPGLGLSQASQAIDKYNRIYFIQDWLFEQKLVHGSKDAYAPLIDFDEQEGVYIKEGLGVFNKERLAGELSPEETQMFGLLTSQMRAGDLTFDLSAKDVKQVNAISLRNVCGNTKIKVLIKGNQPFFLLKTNVNGSLIELIGKRREITPKFNHELEQALESIIQPRLKAVIQKLQSFNSDPIDFGEQLRIQHQDLWKKIAWKKVFPTVSFKVMVKVKLERDGVKR